MPSLAIFPFYGPSLGMLNLGLGQVGLGLACAAWSGIGMALVATVGILRLSEPMGAIKLVYLGLVAMGAVGSNASGGLH